MKEILKQLRDAKQAYNIMLEDEMNDIETIFEYSHLKPYHDKGIDDLECIIMMMVDDILELNDLQS